MTVGEREIVLGSDGLPTDLPCPMPDQLIPWDRLREDGCGCLFGWVGYAFCGDAVYGDAQALWPVAVGFARRVLVRSGLMEPKWRDPQIILTDFDRALTPTRTRSARQLAVARAWREEAELLGYDTSNQPPLPEVA